MFVVAKFSPEGGIVENQYDATNFEFIENGKWVKLTKDSTFVALIRCVSIHSISVV
jgi:hypothetical protein